MSFNPSKCNILRTRPGSKTSLQHFYTLHGQILKEVNTAKYLRVLLMLSNDLSWSPYVDNTAHRANQKLGFIRRNLSGSPITSKCLAYTSLVRSGMEYAASIWDPVSIGDIRKLEMVQRKAARWAKSCFSQSASVTKMLQDLNILKWDMTWQTDGRISESLYFTKSTTKMWTLSSVKLV